MRTIIALFVGLGVSLVLGLWTAWLAVRSPSPIDAITFGAWQAWPNAGTDVADPYSRARLARSGEIPLGSGEGLALLAQTDDVGAPLTARCDYRIAGQTPPARLWTLTLEDAAGRVLTEGDEVAALSGDAILRGSDGSFEIVLSTNPKPGNWISPDPAERFRIVIRLYDTTARGATGVSTLTMPRIMRERCA